MSNFAKWITGIVILALVAFVVTAFTPWGAKTHAEKMGAAVQSSLNANGFKWANVNMSGNVAHLGGDAPSEQAKTAAIKMAESVAYPGHSGDHLWHEVDGSAVKIKRIIPTVLPYTLNASLNGDGELVLNGYVSSAAEREAVLAKAESLFAGKVKDETLKIALGAPNGEWGNVIMGALGTLNKLDMGNLSMENQNILMTGLTTSEDVRAAVNAEALSLPEGYSGAANIRVPNTQAVNVGEINSEAACQSLFGKLKGEKKIVFASNRAEINGDSSFALLNALAAAAKQCSSFNIGVAGYTDSDGDAAYNLDLSQRRAGAVVQYLVENGVNAANVRAIGYGEQNPISDNDTPEGKARNRRIEFKITKSN